MHFVACNIEECGVYKRMKNQKLLIEFNDSGLACAKVEGWTSVKAYYMAKSLIASAKRLNMPHIVARVRKNEVYLINTLI